MKTVGIIGGLGPETTSEFYLEIIFGCYQKNKKNRPPILVWNVPLEYKIEEDLLVCASGEDRYIPYLVDAAKKLENSGADFLAMPCNSLHAFIGEIRNSVEIPVISIVEETVKFLKIRNISKVGLLATTSLLNKKLYEPALKKVGIEQVLPDGLEQARIGKLIKNLVLNRYANKEREELLEIVKNFENKGVKDVILSCSDFQLLIPEHSKLKIYDTMKILADATVDEILR